MTITKEGAIASFYTVNKAPIKHLKVYFNPKQAGSGNASPENVREISGWNSLQVRRTKKNLFPIGTHTMTKHGVTYTYNTDGSLHIQCTGTVSGGYAFLNLTTDFQFYLPSGTYSISGAPSGYGNNIVVYLLVNGNDIEFKSSNGVVRTKAIEGGTAKLQVAVVTSNAFDITIYPQLVVSNDTQYEKPIAHSINNITFPSTLYGGYIDLITGELVAEYETYNLGNCDWHKSNVGSYFYATIPSYPYQEGLQMYCTHYKFDGNGYQDKGYYGENLTFRYYYSPPYPTATAREIYIHDDSYTTTSEFKTAMSNVTLMYPLATPISYQLTPTELQTFIGHNNIWSNADRVEVEYDLAESNDELYTRRRILLQDAPHLETKRDTIAHFTTDMDINVKNVKFYFKPYQDGSGAASPTNLRPIQGFTKIKINHSGLNMLKCDGYSGDGTSHGVIYTKHINENNNIDYITLTGHYDGANNAFRNLSYGGSGHIQKLPRGLISFNSFCNQANVLPVGDTGANYTALDGGGIYSSRNGWFDYDTSNIQPNIGAWARIQIWPNGQEADMNSTVYPMICHQSDRGCEYEPYHGNNLTIEFPALGKNLLDITKTSKLNPGATGSTITISNGVISIDAVAGSARTYVIFSQTFPAGTYTIQAEHSGSVANAKLLCSSEIEGSAYNTYYVAYTKSLGSSKTLTFTLTTASTIGLVLPNVTNESGNPGTLYNIQLEQNSSATTYEPYNNTIYGGYLDLINGKLIKEWDILYLKSKTWGNYSQNKVFYTSNIKTKD